ncbi:MAG TPA: hypothetical protein VEJ67_00545, partial [Candidatus Cybelea sp.]|nr:hypothetical protein [Candidatus Cybelea sp.]
MLRRIRGVILGGVVFFIFLIGAFSCIVANIWFRLPKEPKPPGGGEVGWDLVTVYHNSLLPNIHDSLFWVLLIVFMVGGGLVFGRQRRKP